MSGLDKNTVLVENSNLARFRVQSPWCGKEFFKPEKLSGREPALSWEVGANVGIWTTPWVPWFEHGIPRATFDPRSPGNMVPSKVNELFLPGMRVWYRQLLESTLVA